MYLMVLTQREQDLLVHIHIQPGIHTKVHIQIQPGIHIIILIINRVVTMLVNLLLLILVPERRLHLW